MLESSHNASRKLRASRKDTMRRVLRYVSGYRLELIASLVFAAISVVSQLVIPILTGDAINQIVGAGKVNFDGILPIIGKIALMIAAGAAAQWLMNICNNRITYGVVRDIREEAFSHLQSLPLSYLDSHPSGDIVSRIIADADQFSDGLLMGFTRLFTGVLTIIGTLIFMFSISVPITIVVIVLTPISLFVAAFIARHTFSMFHQQSATRGEQTALIDEMIANQKVVQAFRQEKEVQERFDEVNDRLEKCSMRATFFSSLTNPSTRFVNSLVYAAVAVVGGFSAIAGRINVGQLYSFLSYANQYTKPFNDISGVLTEAHSWYCREDPDRGLIGSQTDLLIVRRDRVVNVCEMKFSASEYALTKRDDEAMRNRINDIQLSTHTSFALHPTLVTTYGLRTNKYSGSIQSVITADDLFRQVD